MRDWQAEAEKWKAHARTHEARWLAAKTRDPLAALAIAEVNEWRRKAAEYDRLIKTSPTPGLAPTPGA